MREAGWLFDYLRMKPFCEEIYQISWGANVFKIEGKVFAIFAMDDQEQGTLSLKCEPVRGQWLREHVKGVRPGYHLNKMHWNTVDLDILEQDEVLRDMIDDSYRLVRAGLPKAVRNRLSMREEP